MATWDLESLERAGQTCSAKHTNPPPPSPESQEPVRQQLDAKLILRTSTSNYGTSTSTRGELKAPHGHFSERD